VNALAVVTARRGAARLQLCARAQTAAGIKTETETETSVQVTAIGSVHMGLIGLTVAACVVRQPQKTSA